MSRGKREEHEPMTTGTLTLTLIILICWNLFLHRKLALESLQRRELAVAFRQFMIERRQPYPPAWLAPSA